MKLIRLIPLVLLAISFHAHALYYCKCDPGAHPSCSASVGSNSNNGSSPSQALLDLPSASALSNAAAGTTHRFCQGGWWTGLGTYVVQNSNVTRAQPLTLTTYAPASGATGRPVFEWANSAAEGLVLGFFNNATPHGGYTLDGIRFRRAGTAGGEGLKLFGNARHVTYNNIQADNWANAMVPATSQSLRYITVRGSWFGPNSQNAILGNADDFLIETTRFDQNNNTGAPGQHAIYIGGCEARRNLTVRKNLFTSNSVTGGQCTSGNITTRGGNSSGVLIEENEIEVPGGNADCFGISVIEGYTACTEHVEGLVIRGNTIKNVGSNSIAVRLCTDCVIENNRIIRDFANTGLHYGISIANPGTPEDTAVSPATGALIRHNSIYVDRQGSGAGISIASGAGHKVVNNVVHLTANVGNANCFAHTARSNFALWDGNWCYEQGGGQWSGAYATLANAQAAGFDANGGNSNPLWVSTPSASSPSMATQAGSPLRNAGRAADKAPFDVLWCARDSTPDVGAHEAGGSPCINFRAPVGLR